MNSKMIDFINNWFKKNVLNVSNNPFQFHWYVLDDYDAYVTCSNFLDSWLPITFEDARSFFLNHYPHVGSTWLTYRHLESFLHVIVEYRRWNIMMEFMPIYDFITWEEVDSEPLISHLNTPITSFTLHYDTPQPTVLNASL